MQEKWDCIRLDAKQPSACGDVQLLLHAVHGPSHMHPPHAKRDSSKLDAKLPRAWSHLQQLLHATRGSHIMHGGRPQVRWDRSKVEGRLLLARCELDEALGMASIYTKAVKAMDALQLKLDGSMPSGRPAEVRRSVLALAAHCATSVPYAFQL